MAQCTAPIRGHRSEAAAEACPVCGGRGRYYSSFMSYQSYGYNPYSKSSSSISNAHSSSSSSTSSTSLKKRARWSPSGSTVLYTPAQLRTLEPVRNNILKQPKTPEKYDMFLCHAWDDRKEAAKDLYDKLTARGINVWFSEKDLQLGTNMLREIDKGLSKSRVGLVLVTPALLTKIEEEGVAEKELSALLAKDRLIPIVHNTTYDALRDISPLLGSRSGLDTSEDSMDEIAAKLAELFTEEAEE